MSLSWTEISWYFPTKQLENLSGNFQPTALILTPVFDTYVRNGIRNGGVVKVSFLKNLPKIRNIVSYMGKTILN